MSYKLNDKISKLTPYEPIQGNYEIRLDANESYFKLDKKIINTAIDINFNRYPDPYAVSLCKAFSKFYSIKPQYVTAGNGSDELISLIVGAFFTHNDTMLTLSSDFSMYKFYAEVFGIKDDVFQKNDDLTVDVDALIAYINDNKVKGVIFSNPCNPTSLIQSKSDIIKLINGVNALVIVDEAYMDFADQSVLEVAHNYDNLIVLKTCSKAVGLAGIRLGFAIANEKITTALKSVKSPYNVNSITQNIGEIVLLNKDYIKHCIQDILKNRDYLYRRIIAQKAKHSAIEAVYKTSTNFVFIKMKNAKDVFEQLLNHSIAVRQMGDFLRITTGNSLENEVLLKTLNEILNRKEVIQ